MPEIQCTKEGPLDKNGTMVVPAMEIPSFRTLVAVESKTDKNLLLCTGGGLGDIICAEPVFRYALRTFKELDISLATPQPHLFRHLSFKKVFDERKEKANFDDFYIFRSMPGHENLQAEFLPHIWMHCVDFISIIMFRAQLPNLEKQIILKPNEIEFEKAALINPETDVAIHAGMTWQSRTFPKWWWDDVLSYIISRGKRPVLIGADSASDRGTVDVSAEGCLDLRNRLSVMESVAVLQTVRVLLTNDSSPIHMAASGDAWIGVVSTARHPDYITHWRNGGEWGWRQKNFSLGGGWNTYDLCPTNAKSISIDKVDPEALLSWLPQPAEFAEWGVEKTNGLH